MGGVRSWARPPGPMSIRHGSSAPFSLLRPQRSCSQCNNINLFLWKWEKKEPFLVLAQRLRTKGKTFKEKRFGIGRSCDQGSPSSLCPWNPCRNLKIVCFFTAEEELNLSEFSIKSCYCSHIDLLVIFMKSALILINMIFGVKITSFILTRQKQ